MVWNMIRFENFRSTLAQKAKPVPAIHLKQTDAECTSFVLSIYVLYLRPISIQLIFTVS